MKSQRGFTLLDILVAIAIFVGIGFTILGVLGAFLRATGHSATTQGGTVTLEQQVDTMRSDAATAFAVFVPANDVFGNSNASGHEIGFYSKSDTGMAVFWAYYYDASARTLRRYDYDLEGHVGMTDRMTGAIDVGEQYPSVVGVSAFVARTLEASDLVGSKSAYAAAIAPLFADATPQPLPVGYDDGAAPRSDLYGGNTTVELQITTDRGSRVMHLATAALPSGFTVHEYPEIRAVVYRVDTTHRFWFGVAQISRVFVNARLLISWNHFTEAHPTVWCDYNIYGNPKGLQAPLGSDSEYQPTWFPETTAGIVYHVTHGLTDGARCSLTPPSPGAVDASGFFSPPPDVIDTPPPCFNAGQCWPANAPPDFSPSPAPSGTPPASWCATHAQSTLCGGTGPAPSATPELVPPGFSVHIPAPLRHGVLPPICARATTCSRGA